MAQFQYKALNAAAAGQIATGAIDEHSEAAVRAALRDRGLIPLEVRPANALAPLAEALNSGRLRSGDQEWFFQTLATLMQAHMPVDAAVSTIEEIATKPRIVAAASTVRTALVSGSDLAAAVARVPGLADERTLAVLRVGMASGRLDHALGLIERSMRTRAEIRRTVSGKLTYPVILLVGSVLAVWFLASFVIPKFAETLTAAGVDLPLATRVTLAAAQHAIYAVPLLAIAIVALIFARPWRRFPALAERIDAWSLTLPVVGPFRWHSEAVTIADTLATVVEGGGEVVPALSHARDAVRSPTVRARLDAASNAVREGTDLGDAISKSQVLPPMSSALVRVGMRTGGLVDALRSVVRTSLEQQQATTQRLLTMMEPATIIFLGALVGWIVYSLISGMLAVNDLGSR